MATGKALQLAEPKQYSNPSKKGSASRFLIAFELHLAKVFVTKSAIVMQKNAALATHSDCLRMSACSIDWAMLYAMEIHFAMRLVTVRSSEMGFRVDWATRSESSSQMGTWTCSQY